MTINAGDSSFCRDFFSPHVKRFVGSFIVSAGEVDKVATGLVNLNALKYDNNISNSQAIFILRGGGFKVAAIGEWHFSRDAEELQLTRLLAA